MRAARHGGFADESARGGNCRGVCARHAETFALTQLIAKAPPPRYCWLGCCGVLVNFASAAVGIVATALSA